MDAKVNLEQKPLRFNCGDLFAEKDSARLNLKKRSLACNVGTSSRDIRVYVRQNGQVSVADKDPCWQRRRRGRSAMDKECNLKYRSLNLNVETACSRTDIDQDTLYSVNEEDSCYPQRLRRSSNIDLKLNSKPQSLSCHVGTKRSGSEVRENSLDSVDSRKIFPQLSRGEEVSTVNFNLNSKPRALFGNFGIVNRTPSVRQTNKDFIVIKSRRRLSSRSELSRGYLQLSSKSRSLSSHVGGKYSGSVVRDACQDAVDKKHSCRLSRLIEVTPTTANLYSKPNSLSGNVVITYRTSSVEQTSPDSIVGKALSRISSLRELSIMDFQSNSKPRSLSCHVGATCSLDKETSQDSVNGRVSCRVSRIEEVPTIDDNSKLKPEPRLCNDGIACRNATDRQAGQVSLGSMDTSWLKIWKELPDVNENLNVNPTSQAYKCDVCCHGNLVIQASENPVIYSDPQPIGFREQALMDVTLNLKPILPSNNGETTSRDETTRKINQDSAVDMDRYRLKKHKKRFALGGKLNPKPKSVTCDAGTTFREAVASQVSPKSFLKDYGQLRICIERPAIDGKFHRKPRSLAYNVATACTAAPLSQDSIFSKDSFQLEKKRPPIDDKLNTYKSRSYNVWADLMDTFLKQASQESVVTKNFRQHRRQKERSAIDAKLNRKPRPLMTNDETSHREKTVRQGSHVSVCHKDHFRERKRRERPSIYDKVNSKPRSLTCKFGASFKDAAVRQVIQDSVVGKACRLWRRRNLPVMNVKYYPKSGDRSWNDGPCCRNSPNREVLQKSNDSEDSCCQSIPCITCGLCRKACRSVAD